MAAYLKDILVKRMKFTVIHNASILKSYINYCTITGRNSDLYQDPYIPSSFYDTGVALALFIQRAISKYTSAPTKGNYSAIKTAKTRGKKWLKAYADMVEVIANDDANRSTLDEAATNIMLSYLTPRKIKSSDKKDQETPKFTAKSVGDRMIKTKITNGKSYNPAITNFILIDKACEATVTLNDGEVVIDIKKQGLILFKTANARGSNIVFKGLKRSGEYLIYAYAQDGNKKTSELSPPRYVKI